ncbi:MFS transporter [Amycolatopsis acidicola]|uniref:MFS transporter n=1 Tax=Amycolatopsis acidicola TaxID=2596893 RepID=A0A5N0V6B4_9PSEU|nr:MFS transporter [Amycolatopsis acidicola]KAA9160703.1 MFS transporter [Amycolatopsis acidicola]
MKAPLRSGPIRPNIILVICCASVVLVGIDSTIVNVALPRIGSELGSGVTGLQWIVDAYTLVVASLLIVSGGLGDRLGRRGVFEFGLAAFGIGSFLCSLAANASWLIAFRSLQAIGGSMLNPLALAILSTVFSAGKERARAIGVWGATMGVTQGLGPCAGGLLTDCIGWRSIFWINVPIVLAMIVSGRRHIPVIPRRSDTTLDVPGQALILVTLGAATFTMIEAPRLGWGSPAVVVAASLAAVGLCGLVGWERVARNPILDYRRLKNRAVVAALAAGALVYLVMGTMLFVNTLYLQYVRQLSPIVAGLCIVPAAVAMALASPLAARLAEARGNVLPLVLTGVGICAGAAMLTGLTPSTPLVYVALAYVVITGSVTFVNPPISNIVLAAFPPEDATVAASLASTSRSIGTCLGVAVVGYVVSPGATSGAGTWSQADNGIWILMIGLGAVVVGCGWAMAEREKRWGLSRR